MSGASATGRQEPAPAEKAEAGTAGLRVLVVEDDTFISMMLEDMLDDLGCRTVGPAAYLAEALEAARTEPFDVALLDVSLGRDLVYPVADMLAARAVPFAFMTGHDSGSLPERYQLLPSLSKPYVESDLKRILLMLSAVR